MVQNKRYEILIKMSVKHIEYLITFGDQIVYTRGTI